MAVKSVVSTVFYVVKAAWSPYSHRGWSFKKLFGIFLEGAIFPDLSDSAKQVLNDERVHTVCFGHSHVYQYRQWSQDKEYFNSGTWTEITSLDIVSLGKITKLTYILFEYPEDGARPRGRLKEWRGFHRIEEDVAVS